MVTSMLHASSHRTPLLLVANDLFYPPAFVIGPNPRSDLTNLIYVDWRSQEWLSQFVQDVRKIFRREVTFTIIVLREVG